MKETFRRLCLAAFVCLMTVTTVREALDPAPGDAVADVTTVKPSVPAW